MTPDHLLPKICLRYLDYYSHQVRAQGSVRGMQWILTGLDIYLQKSGMAECANKYNENGTLK